MKRALTAPFRWIAAPIRQPKRGLLCLISALMIVLAFPPFEIGFLVFFAYVPLIAVALDVRPAAAFGWGLLTGLLITALGFYFIVELLMVFGGMPAAVAVPLHLLFSVYQGTGIALFAALASALGRRSWPLAVVIPATYTAAEVLCREYYIFPWYLSNATYHYTRFVQAVDLFGGLGLTALIVLVNAVLYQMLAAWWASRKGRELGLQKKDLPKRGLIVAAVLVVSALAYGEVRVRQVDSLAAEQPELRVGLVEADIGIFAKADPTEVLNNMLIHQRMSAQLEARGADLIVWPETAANPPFFLISTEPTTDLEVLRESLQVVQRVPRDVTYFHPSAAPMAGDFRDDLQGGRIRQSTLGIQRGFRTPLLFGVMTTRPPRADEAAEVPPHPRSAMEIRYNTAVLIDADGRVLGTYDKNVLLVFGEYVPLSHLLYRLFGFNFYELIPAAGDVTKGEGVTVMELPLTRDDGSTLTVRIGAMICYEDIIAEYGLEMAKLEPNVFINIINDAWFGQSSAAHHHNAFSVLRAVEHRIPLIRATNTGVSSIIDPVGRLVEQTRLTDAETILADVPIMPPPSTLYSRIGDVVGWLAWLCVVVLGGLSRWRRRPPAAADDPTDEEQERVTTVDRQASSGSGSAGSRSRSGSTSKKQRRRRK